MPTEGCTDPKRLFLIHTVPGLIPILDPLAARALPGWERVNMVDESLLKNTIRAGSLSQTTMRRLLSVIWSAVDAGAQAVLVTCSSLGPAVEAARPFCPVPLVRIDTGMALAAVAGHARIGVLATLPSTLTPTTDLIRATAQETGAEDCTIESQLCAGAFECLAQGDTEGHDQMVAEAIAAMATKVDVIVLAQASMARAAARIQAPVPILTSPEPGIAHLARVLAA
ncbi:MAG: aspartate/glutamate racemase family protein [Paracoccaceae bacterium]|nr:aspartate/glutamate racemase family protein [Paracoccaceae bacterium]